MFEAMEAHIERMDLVKFQEQAKNRALEDDVRFVIDSFREGTDVVACALKAMLLFADSGSRKGMAEVGMYSEAINAMSLACGSVALKESSAYSRELSLLATSQVVLLHCASCSRSEAAKRVNAAQLGRIFSDLFKLRQYMTIELTAEHAAEFSKAMDGCKASQFFPPMQGFQHSAMALLLVAARVCLGAKLFSETVKDSAVKSGFCKQLQEIAAENMAVLTGRQSPSFTRRTNSCMWFADMAQACLERVTGAHASNCEHLVTSRAKFGSDGIVGFPAIPLSCAQFARVPQLMQNKATQLCIATNLQLLMNITHSTSGSDCVMALGGIYALSHLIWHLAVTPSGQGPYPTAPGEDLPDTQDIFCSIPQSHMNPSEHVSQRSQFEPNADAACSHQQQITSAMCVLVNMVEHSPAAGACIAALDIGGQDDAQAPLGSTVRSPRKCVQATAPNDCEHLSSQIVSSQQSTDSTSQARLASGSRRRRRNGLRHAGPEPAMQPKAARVALHQISDPNGDEVSRGTELKPPPSCSFVQFLCKLLNDLWESRSSVRLTSDTDLDSSVGIVQLYTSILLGAVVHSTPDCRKSVQHILQMDRLIADMETGLNFYDKHGAIEASSKLFFQQAIESLKATR